MIRRVWRRMRWFLPLVRPFGMSASMSAAQHAEVNIEINEVCAALEPVRDRLACPRSGGRISGLLLPPFGRPRQHAMDRIAESMTYGVTIGQAAVFAGITIKTVRHYHKLGLLDEPARDSSGYRRYGSPELLRLVQVRTLAAAGVPLADIGPLIDSDPAQFADALADAEQRLTARITELTAQRDMLHRLTSGDRTLLPDRAVALLEGMPTLGFTPHDVQTARESFVLAKALVSEGFDDYLTDIEHALHDPRFVELAERSAEVIGWEPDDPQYPRTSAGAEPRRSRLVPMVNVQITGHSNATAGYPYAPNRTGRSAARGSGLPVFPPGSARRSPCREHIGGVSTLLVGRYGLTPDRPEPPAACARIPRAAPHIRILRRGIRRDDWGTRSRADRAIPRWLSRCGR